jgi:hypothetical protein
LVKYVNLGYPEKKGPVTFARYMGQEREEEGADLPIHQDYIRFLRIAQGSLKELETHILVAQEVGILPKGQCEVGSYRTKEMIVERSRAMASAPPLFTTHIVALKAMP